MFIDDDILQQCAKPITLKVWQPTTPMVVLGNSNDASLECHQAACHADDVPILKRYGGGGTVVLYPGTAIISLGLWVRDYYQNDFYFRHLNQSILNALAAFWPIFATARQDGISDLVFGDKKFAGTSLFRSRNYLLYQASVIGALNLALIDRYLPLPSRQPEYRQRRSHRDFLTATMDIHPSATAEKICSIFTAELNAEVSKSPIKEKCIAPQLDQLPHLYNRASKSA